MHRRQHSQENAKKHGNHHGRQRELQSGGEIAGQFAGHGHLGADGHAHVSVEKAFHVENVLGKHRLIQSQGLPRRLQRFRRRMRSYQHAGRVTGDDVGNAEGNDGNAYKDKDEMNQFLKYKSP